MRTRLKVGSNQYKTQRQVRARAIILAAPIALAIYIGIESVVFFLKSFRSLRNPAPYLLVFTLLFASTAIASAPKANLTESYQARTAYKIPTLNPNISERDQNIALIKKIWGKDAKLGLEIARCESGYRTAGAHVANTNHTIDQGIFSINSVHNMPEMEVAVANISYAYIMYQEQGTDPWTSSESCWK